MFCLYTVGLVHINKYSPLVWKVLYSLCIMGPLAPSFSAKLNLLVNLVGRRELPSTIISAWKYSKSNLCGSGPIEPEMLIKVSGYPRYSWSLSWSHLTNSYSQLLQAEFSGISKGSPSSSFAALPGSHSSPPRERSKKIQHDSSYRWDLSSPCLWGAFNTSSAFPLQQSSPNWRRAWSIHVFDEETRLHEGSCYSAAWKFWAPVFPHPAGPKQWSLDYCSMHIQCSLYCALASGLLLLLEYEQWSVTCTTDRRHKSVLYPLTTSASIESCPVCFAWLALLTL